MQKGEGTDRSGYYKIRQTCALALQDNLQYAWIDTCCIDKTSSAELSEAINSMMSWYQRSEVCYTYLVDVPPGTDIHQPASLFAKSRWFSRGWTLQELIAPSKLIFLYNDWSFMRARDEIVVLVSKITGIDQTFLSVPTTPPKIFANSLQSRLNSASIAQRMSWASKRKTTRVEDAAYSLLGIFGISMPLLYGEGMNAFLRLQEQIMTHSDDQTLLAWRTRVTLPKSLCELDDFEKVGVLATSPAAFSGCQDLIPCDVGMPTSPFSITNKGLRIEMPMSQHEDFTDCAPYMCGLLQCRTKQDPTKMIGIPLHADRNGLFVRVEKPLQYLNYKTWSKWPMVSVNLLPSSSFASSITEAPTFTVFLEHIPYKFFVAEVYPPDWSQQHDPRIIMVGTPDEIDELKSRSIMVLLKSSDIDVDPLVLKVVVEPVSEQQESMIQATSTFVNTDNVSEEAVFDGISLRSSLDHSKRLKFLDFTERPEGIYRTRCRGEMHFGKPLFLIKIYLEGTEEDDDSSRRGFSEVFDDLTTSPGLDTLHEEWAKTLQRLGHLFRNSLRVAFRSLVLSPWMFTFVIDSLIRRTFRLIEPAIQKLLRWWPRYLLLYIGDFLFFKWWFSWKIKQAFQSIRFAKPLQRPRTLVFEILLFYLCLKSLPSDLLAAVTENRYKVLAVFFIHLRSCFVYADKGLNLGFGVPSHL